MSHAEILVKAEAYRKGELSPEEKAEFTGHLKTCSACREIVGKWPKALPREGFTQRVMAGLEKETVARRKEWKLRPALLAGGAVAVMLAISAFWHPERKWVEVDKYFARVDAGPTLAMMIPGRQGDSHE